MLPQFSFQLISADVDRELDRLASAGAITAEIHNDARGSTGFEYWSAVNSGRRGFGPKTAKALRFVGGRDGQTVFARWVRAVPGRWMREQAIPSITSAAGAILSQTLPFTKESIIQTVNRIADAVEFEIAKRTPRRSGKLAESYRVERAK